MRKYITDAESTELAKAYAQGESSRSLCERFQCTSPTVLNHCRRHGVPSRPVGESSRRYTLNHGYFSVIDTEEKAYWLGMMGADGYVDDRGGVSLGLSGDEEKDLLARFAQALGSNAPVETRKIRYPGSKTPYRLSLASKPMQKDLARLGVVQRKSLIYQFPTSDQVPDHLLRHYVRGYMDGDGCASLKRDGSMLVGFTSSPAFIRKLAEVLKQKLDLNAHIETYVRSRASNLKLGGTLVCFILLDWMYRDATVYLPRKHAKYLVCKEMVLAKLSEPARFYNVYRNPKVMESATRCAQILGVPFDMSAYNGLSLTVSEQQEVIDLYVRQGLGFRRIEALKGYSSTMVKNTLKRNGVESRPSNRPSLLLKG